MLTCILEDYFLSRSVYRQREINGVTWTWCHFCCFWCPRHLCGTREQTATGELCPVEQHLPAGDICSTVQMTVDSSVLVTELCPLPWRGSFLKKIATKQEVSVSLWCLAFSHLDFSILLKGVGEPEHAKSSKVALIRRMTWGCHCWGICWKYCLF